MYAQISCILQDIVPFGAAAVSASVLITSIRKDTITQSHPYTINIAAKINDDEY